MGVLHYVSCNYEVILLQWIKWINTKLWGINIKYLILQFFNTYLVTLTSTGFFQYFYSLNATFLCPFVYSLNSPGLFSNSRCIYQEEFYFHKWLSFYRTLLYGKNVLILNSSSLFPTTKNIYCPALKGAWCLYSVFLITISIVFTLDISIA